jgi:hypothetical protein
VSVGGVFSDLHSWNDEVGLVQSACAFFGRQRSTLLRAGADWPKLSDMEVKTKVCPGCGQIKPRSGFSKDRTKAGGLQSICKRCVPLYAERRAEKLVGAGDILVDYPGLTPRSFRWSEVIVGLMEIESFLWDQRRYGAWLGYPDACTTTMIQLFMQAKAGRMALEKLLVVQTYLKAEEGKG